MANQTKDNPVLPDFEISVRVENLTVTPRENDLEVSAHFIVYGFVRPYSKNIYISVKPDYSPETLLEKITDNLIENFGKSLVTACRANLTESIFSAFGFEKKGAIKAAREVILKMYKEDYNERNKTPKAPNQEKTLDELVDEVIKAWQILETEAGHEIENPSREDLALAMNRSVKNFAEQYSKHKIFLDSDFPLNCLPIGRDLDTRLSEIKLTFKTFRNYCRFKKKLRDTQDLKT